MLALRDTLDHLDRAASQACTVEGVFKSASEAETFAGRVRELRAALDKAQNAEPSFALIAAAACPKLTGESLRVTFAQFAKQLARVAEKSGLAFKLVKPLARNREAGEILCRFEGTPLPRQPEMKSLTLRAAGLPSAPQVSEEEQEQLRSLASSAAAERADTPLVRPRVAAFRGSQLEAITQLPLRPAGDGREQVRFFVSYAHKDDDLARRLLGPLETDLNLSTRFRYDFWRDHLILPGELWHDEIQDALRDCDFGLALLSRDFLSSQYITEKELPALAAGEKPVLPVCLGLLDFDRQNLRGLDEKQIYRYAIASNERRCFSQCSGPVVERFISDLAKTIEARVAKSIQARKEALTVRALSEPELMNTLARENPKFHDAIQELQRFQEEESTPDTAPRPGHQPQKHHALRDFAQHMLPPESKAKVEAAASVLNLAEAERLALGGDAALAVLERQRQDALKFLIGWFRDPAQPPFAAVLGEIGSGKTTLLQMLARALVSGQRHDAPPVFFVDLRDYLGDADPTLEHLLADQLRRHDSSGKLTVQDIKEAVQTGGALIIFDGLDEKIIPLADGPRQRFVSELFRILPPEIMDRPAKSGRGRIIISCRSHYFPSVLALASGFVDQQRSRIRARDYTACFMLPWNERQVADYLAQTLGAHRVGTALEIIATIHNLTDLSRRPYLLSLIVPQLGDLERQRAEGKPVNGASLYASFVEKWLLRDEGKHQFTKEHKLLMMESLAADLWRENAREWPWSRVADWLDQFLHENPRIADRYARSNVSADILNQDFRTATFFLRPDTSKDAFRFAHTSLQEYFLASHLIKSLAQPNAAAVWDLPMPSNETFHFAGQIMETLSEAELPRVLQGLKMLLEDAAHTKQTRSAALKMLLHQARYGLPVPEKTALAAQGLDLHDWEFISTPERPLDLSEANFSGAVLYDTKFHHIGLSSSRWQGAFAPSAEFVSCGLEQASFVGDGISLLGARFRRCRLRGSVLTNVLLDGVRADLPIWDEATASHWRAVLGRARSTEAGPLTRPWFEMPEAECSCNTVNWQTSRTYITEGSIYTRTGLGRGLRWDVQTGIPIAIPELPKRVLEREVSHQGEGMRLNISKQGNLLWTRPDGTELESAILPNDGFAVLQRRPGGRWRLVRARGDYWRYVNYAEDTPEGRRIHTADALGEPERLPDGTFVWPQHAAPPE